MNLNVDSYSELCDSPDHKTPERFIGMDGEYMPGSCQEDSTCQSAEAKMNCCNDPSPAIKKACRAQKCYDRGTSWFGSNVWPAYNGGKNDLDQLGEPYCVAAARKHFKKLVMDYKPDVVATQDDFENMPLQVEGYTTIISANSYTILCLSPYNF
jgi:hypothetical protein